MTSSLRRCVHAMSLVAALTTACAPTVISPATDAGPGPDGGPVIGVDSGSIDVDTGSIGDAGSTDVDAGPPTVSDAGPLTSDAGPTRVVAVEPSPTVLYYGSMATLAVRLSGPAALGGQVVCLAAVGGLGVPAMVTVPAGATTAEFVANPEGPGPRTATVSATVAGSCPAAGPPDADGMVWIGGPGVTPALTSLTPTTGVISSTVLTVTLSPGPPTGSLGQAVTLSSSDPGVTVPSSVVVLPGATSASFSATGVPAGLSATITAALHGVSFASRLDRPID